MKVAVWRICLFIIVLAVSSIVPDIQASPAQGKVLYTKYCAFCHGKVGQGRTPMARVLQPPPRIFADPVAMARLNDNDLYRAIKQGKSGTAMPVWGRLLTESQIRDVMQYVKSLKQPLPAGMTQTDFDIRVGERIYRQYCIVCHGMQGNGQTHIGRVLTRHPRDFTNVEKMAHLSNRQMVEAIRNGKPKTAMVAWKNILNSEDVRRVILFIRQISQRPSSRGSR